MPKKKQIKDTLVRSEDFSGFLEEFQSESDRAVALLGAALLDEHLRQLLHAFFIDDKEEAGKLLDNPSAPLQTFSARTRTAYCFPPDRVIGSSSQPWRYDPGSR